MASQVYYEIARWRLDEQLTYLRELNARLAGVFTAATALLVLFAAFQDWDATNPTQPLYVLLIAAGIVYVLLVIVTFIGYLDHGLALGPSLRNLRESELDDDRNLRLAADAMARAVSNNSRRINQKRQMLTAAVALWATDVLLFVGVVASGIL